MINTVSIVKTIRSILHNEIMLVHCEKYTKDIDIKCQDRAGSSYIQQHLLHIAHLLQQCHNSKFVIFLEKSLKVLKCYNFL
jgi:hypothetical protein